MFQTEVVEKIKTRILCAVTPPTPHHHPTELCHLWGNVEIYCRARQATDDTVAHMHCMLDI